MEFQELIRQRYSVRSFSPRPVEDEKLQKILEAGQAAPTARNGQPQRVLVVKSPEALEKIRQCTPCHYNAPVVLVMCRRPSDAPIDPEKGVNGDPTPLDASIALTHMMLCAADLGLGSCWVGLYYKDKLRQMFHVPEGLEIVSLLPIGYPAEDAAPGPAHTQRLPLSETVFFDTF